MSQSYSGSGSFVSTCLSNHQSPRGHGQGPRELDLSSYSRESIMDWKIHAVQGLKTSTAFFKFLRANLVANPSVATSYANTPTLEAASPQIFLPSPKSPLTEASTVADAVASDLSLLSVDVLTRREEKADALKLVADSVTQQRRSALRYLFFQPALMALLGVFLTFAYHWSWSMRRNLSIALLLHLSLITTYLLAISFFTNRYIRVAEKINRDWLVSADGEEDTVIGVWLGETLIGALFLRLAPPNSSSSSSNGNRRRSRAAALRGGKGIIRAWTVRLKYRSQGVGRKLLRDAVRITRERCGRDAKVGFAQEHANSAKVLPEFLNGQVRKEERKAAGTLDEVLAKSREGGSRRKGR